MVGLRNPGTAYAGTRHNIGADVVALAAKRLGERFKRARRGIRADVAEIGFGDHRAVLVLPRTFMNDSGTAVAQVIRYFGTAPDDLLVVHDDIDLPFTKMRIQFGRGAGGNNGVESVIRSLRTREFWRLKLGVGRPPGSMDPADFVLRPFPRNERPEAEVMVQRAADLVEMFVGDGAEAARQRAGELNT